MRLVAEYIIDQGIYQYPGIALTRQTKKIRMIVKRLVELKALGCRIIDIKQKYDGSITSPFFLHVRVYE